MINKKPRTTIAVSKENYEALQKYAYVGENFDTALTRVLKSASKQKETT
jgi:hypothetical protein